MALSPSQQDSADFLRTKQSGERALGEGRSHRLVPQLRMGEVEGGGLYCCFPGTQPHLAFSPLLGWRRGRGTAPPHDLGNYSWPQGTSVQTRAPPLAATAPCWLGLCTA